MPNTAIAVGQSISCLVFEPLSRPYQKLVEGMFETVGTQIELQEELMTSATALGACGIAFFLRAIRAATQGGIEIGFHASEALKIALQVAKGAALLLEQPGAHPENEIDKVTSPRGCTIAGLNEMEHKGFSSALIMGIKTSADKAGKLYE
jgi:pyrroline-5-carboxylate reductase